MENFKSEYGNPFSIEILTEITQNWSNCSGQKAFTGQMPTNAATSLTVLRPFLAIFMATLFVKRLGFGFWIQVSDQGFNGSGIWIVDLGIVGTGFQTWIRNLDLNYGPWNRIMVLDFAWNRIWNLDYGTWNKILTELVEMNFRCIE